MQIQLGCRVTACLATADPILLLFHLKIRVAEVSPFACIKMFVVLAIHSYLSATLKPRLQINRNSMSYGLLMSSQFEETRITLHEFTNCGDNLLQMLHSGSRIARISSQFIVS